MAALARGLGLLLAFASLEVACGPSAPAPVAVPVPPPLTAPASTTSTTLPLGTAPTVPATAKTPEEIAAIQEKTSCESKANLRLAAGCYLNLGNEEGIGPLFVIGRAFAQQAVKYPVSEWPNFTYAAENAGTLAATTKDERLYTGIGQASETDQLFAVRAINHMLAKLRWGQIHGKDADDAVRRERLPRAHAACLSALATTSGMLVSAAADCLKEIHDPADTAALIRAAVASSDMETESHVLEIASTAGDPFPTAELKALTPLLEKPLTAQWRANDITARGSACRVLARGASGQAWAKKAAATAAKEVGTRIGPAARDACIAVVLSGP
jgi:hypothetical protein